jgi:hypothetical protein
MRRAVTPTFGIYAGNVEFYKIISTIRYNVQLKSEPD